MKNRVSTTLVCLLGALLAPKVCTSANAQQPTALHFEVASIKPSSVTGPPASRLMPDGFAISGASLRILVQTAFDLPGYRVKGWPAWAGDRFDIDARAPGGRTYTRREILSMVQSLLVDRFQLRFRVQPEEMNVLALVVDKGGHRMKEYR